MTTGKELEKFDYSAALLLVFILVSGCAATKVKETWKRPGYTRQGSKGLPDRRNRNDKFRKLFENVLASRLQAQGVTGVPSYPDLVISGNIDRETLRAKLRAQGTDAVLVARNGR